MYSRSTRCELFVHGPPSSFEQIADGATNLNNDQNVIEKGIENVGNGIGSFFNRLFGGSDSNASGSGSSRSAFLAAVSSAAVNPSRAVLVNSSRKLASTFGVLTVVTDIERSVQYHVPSTSIRQANNSDEPPA